VRNVSSLGRVVRVAVESARFLAHLRLKSTRSEFFRRLQLLKFGCLLVLDSMVGKVVEKFVLRGCFGFGVWRVGVFFQVSLNLHFLVAKQFDGDLFGKTDAAPFVAVGVESALFDLSLGFLLLVDSDSVFVFGSVFKQSVDQTVLVFPRHGHALVLFGHYAFIHHLRMVEVLFRRFFNSLSVTIFQAFVMHVGGPPGSFGVTAAVRGQV